MKSTQQIITLLCLLALSSVAASQQIPGCQINTGKYCYQCFNRKPLAPKQGCGPLLPKSDNCEAYFYDDKAKRLSCGQCKAGYALKAIGVQKFKCVPSHIKGCLVEIDLPGKTIATLAPRKVTTLTSTPRPKKSLACRFLRASSQSRTASGDLC